MNYRIRIRASFLALFGLVFATESAPQNALTPSTAPMPAPAAAPDTSGAQVLGFRPGLDDLMTMLIQPRHTKLFLAGSRMNWELATSQARDLRGAFRRISQYMPRYLGIDVGEAIRSIIDSKLDLLDAAIAAGDSKRFGKAFEGVTDACNACHAYMEHGYHVIKVPSSSVSSIYPDQEFSPTP